ncbi:MAG TPA: DUF4438 domain-containing protein [candidate division WOR-3 bacterium]|uniref:DUF4438 domain-containing protein n=1 Tax=candidate division WOR-3 bacterium TaxID=2052148 RepID=A0A9C9EP40_UNCW3|nr:DUF4438 domain-containing protein [candidate division WOR-3 bacterium]
MLRTNEKKLVMMSVQGKVCNPGARRMHGVDAQGKPFHLPGTGGIVYNIKVGDPAFGWEADHIEPCVSSILDEKNRYDSSNTGYVFYACVGNEAIIKTGDAKGKKGIVTGHHGGAEHVMIDFPDSVLEKLTHDDKIMIKGYGQGLKLLDYPDVVIYNLDPRLLRKMGLKAVRGKLRVPVTAKIPAELMGSGTGSLMMTGGDYDIMTTDKKFIKKYQIDKLRFGDFVALMNHDNVYGRSFRKGAVTIGIVIHGDCRYAGHGPGVTTLMSAAKPIIEPVINPNANIAKIMKIGRFRKR